MKSLMLTLGAVLVSAMVSQAHAAVSEIACWDMYSKRGSKPIMKAKVLSANTLSDIRFDFKTERFEVYFIDRTTNAGERWGHKPEITKSSIANPPGDLEAKEITTKRSPYYGNNEYAFEFGKWSFDAPYIKQKNTYDARLILPKDLSPEALKTFRIRYKTERSNAVMIYDSAYDFHQSGDNYLRMFCASH